MTTSTAIDEAVERLVRSAATGVPCDPVHDLIGADDIDAAYRVQSAVIARRLAGGATRIGRKIGLTSLAVQQQLGVDQPDFGVLLDDMVVPDGGLVAMSRLLQPKVEGELAFRLRADLDGAARQPDGAGRGRDACTPRSRSWTAASRAGTSRLADTVADNASSGLFVVSERGAPLDAVPTCRGAVDPRGEW